MGNGSTKTSYPLKSFQVSRFITFIMTFVVLYGPASWALSKPPLEILAVVLSKTCPLPDSPDLKMDSPESIMKSADDPSCPKHGDIQLIQTAITNRGKASHQVGVEIAVFIENQPSSEKSFRKVLEIPSLDTVRVLHDMKLNENGYYRVLVRLWNHDFKKKWYETPPAAIVV